MEEDINSPSNYPKYSNHLESTLRDIERDLPYAPELRAAVEAAQGDPLLICQAWNRHYRKWQMRWEPYHASVEFPRMLAAYKQYGVFLLFGRFTFETETPKGALSHAKWLAQIKPLVGRALALGMKFTPQGTSYDWRDAEQVLRELGYPVTRPYELRDYNLPQYHSAQMYFFNWRMQGDLDYMKAWLDYFEANK